MYEDFDLGAVQMEATGMDAFLDDGKTTEAVDIRKLAKDQKARFRVSSVDQLSGFQRVANDTLVRKSERDLWSLNQTEEGEWVVERLFDEDGNPLTV